MQLVSVNIKNFRSLKNVSISLGEHTAFIGGNGAGKSSVLRAIEKFYSTAKNLDADDFYGRDQTNAVEIELTFGFLSDDEAETFASRVREAQLVVTRVFDCTASSGRYYGSVLQNPDFIEIRQHQTAAPKNAAYRELRTSNLTYADLPVAANAQAVDAALLSWEAAHSDSLELARDNGQFFGFQNASREALGRHTSFVFIPAVRDASVDASDGKSSVIGKLLELLVRSAVLQRQEIVDFRAEVNARYLELVSPESMPELGVLANHITADLRGIYEDAEVGLNWREVGEFPIPLPTADVTLTDDGFGGPVDRQGHGLQRALVFTLLQQLARSSLPVTNHNPNEAGGDVAPVAQAPSLILAIEEPELYQHPTKQRHFSRVLRQLSAGTLPGADGRTQIVFASHSPHFISLRNADEIRLARRIADEDTEFKQCQISALDLEIIAQKLETATQRPQGTFSAATLVPKLHIVGNEVAEGFFANGIVLVEGRSDKAALDTIAQLLGRNFESAGIAILPVEGKGNLFSPLAIFRELGIPTFCLWDCDVGVKKTKPIQNLHLLRLLDPDQNHTEAPKETAVGDAFAHFEINLEATLQQDLGEDIFIQSLGSACEEFDFQVSDDSIKMPEIMHATILNADSIGRRSATLEAIVKAIWLHLTGNIIQQKNFEPAPPVEPEYAPS